VNPDDVVEARIGAKAERAGAACVEVARPALDDAHDGWVRRLADAAHRLIASEASQRLDLLADRC